MEQLVLEVLGNLELQNNLNANLTGVATTLAANNAVYDIGHLFGASGGGGNAGCIGCVCVSPTANNQAQKGSGYTSPSAGLPQGDTFDIDYVAHEYGHQFGGNHTFTTSVRRQCGKYGARFWSNYYGLCRYYWSKYRCC